MRDLMVQRGGEEEGEAKICIGSERCKHQKSRSQMKRTAFIFFGAEGGSRTRTGLRPHGPEPCASTSFTTSASSIPSGQNISYVFFVVKHRFFVRLRLTVTSATAVRAGDLTCSQTRGA